MTEESKEFISLKEINSNKLTDEYIDEFEEYNKLDEGITIYQVQGILTEANNRKLVADSLVKLITEINNITTAIPNTEKKKQKI